jgi:hypothetical protein
VRLGLRIGYRNTAEGRGGIWIARLSSLCRDASSAATTEWPLALGPILCRLPRLPHGFAPVPRPVAAGAVRPPSRMAPPSSLDRAA